MSSGSLIAFRIGRTEDHLIVALPMPSTICLTMDTNSTRIQRLKLACHLLKTGPSARNMRLTSFLLPTYYRCVLTPRQPSLDLTDTS